MIRLIKGLKLVTRVVKWIIRMLKRVLNVFNSLDSTRVGLIVIREAKVNSREALGIMMNRCSRIIEFDY